MKKRMFTVIKFLVIICISVISLAPFYQMIIMSTYKTEDIFKGLKILPGNYLIENINTVMASDFIQTYVNSLVVSVSATVFCVLISAMAGFALTMYKFRAKKVIYYFILFTMMVPSQLGILGFMVEMRWFGLSGTLLPLIMPWLAIGFGAFWMCQYMKSSLQPEIIESARIDGGNEIGIFFKIVLPYIIPAITTLALLVFLWTWNQYMPALVFVNKPQLMTIPLYIRSLGNQYRQDYAAQLAGLTLATIPLILMFVLGSKSFIKGLTAGAVKG